MVKLQLRKNEERGSFQSNTITAKYSFSFSDYISSKHRGHGSLQVLNEDTISSKGGFEMHEHENFEILSYIISGELEHIDDMGNRELVKKGMIQFTSAGRGIRHSEKNISKKKCHLLQLWIAPLEFNLTPKYQTLSYNKLKSINQFLPIASPITKILSDTVGVNANCYISCLVLQTNDEVIYKFLNTYNPSRKVYIHLIENQSNSSICWLNNDFKLSSGDGAYLDKFQANESKLLFKKEGEQNLELLVFEMYK
ncbi:RmlC-like cupin [Neoconidiobolus thromboides FSU 785]|nr:RmlC-like cupin [Neoconidiobolus thromboides FSU 785]